MNNWPQILVATEKGYSKCFGCGKDNPIGLKLNFTWDGHTATGKFTPTELYQGWPGIVHGGILICILDEVMSYAALFTGSNSATAQLEAKLKSPAPIGKTLIASARVTSQDRRLVKTKSTISLEDGTLIAEGTGTHFVINGSPEDGQSAEVRAVIWDMDGVIVDTGRYHFKSWHEAFRKRGIDFTEAEFRSHFGQRNDTIIRDVLGQDTPQSEIDAITREKEGYFRDTVRDNIKALPGAIALMKSLAEHGFKMALASSAPVENIELLTTTLGIKDCFQTIVSGREVPEGKPSPQGFLLAAQRLGATPKNCVVIEDAIAGVAAAKRAGMRCIAVTTTNPRAALRDADLIVDSLEKVSAADIEKLLKPAVKSPRKEGV